MIIHTDRSGQMKLSQECKDIRKMSFQVTLKFDNLGLSVPKEIVCAY